MIITDVSRCLSGLHLLFPKQYLFVYISDNRPDISTNVPGFQSLRPGQLRLATRPGAAINTA